MKKNQIVTAALVTLSAVAMLHADTAKVVKQESKHEVKTTTVAAHPAPAAAVVAHGNQSAGVVESVNDKAKSFVLDVAGKDQTVYWNAGTKVSGGKLAAKEHVTVRWMSQQGKATATSISIAAAAAPAPAKK